MTVGGPPSKGLVAIAGPTSEPPFVDPAVKRP
jgi:hypothetical protein